VVLDFSSLALSFKVTSIRSGIAPVTASADLQVQAVTGFLALSER